MIAFPSKEGAKETTTSMHSPVNAIPPRMSRPAQALEVTVLAGVCATKPVLVKFGCDITWPFLKELSECVWWCVCIWGHQLQIDLIQFSLAPYTYKTLQLYKSTSATCTSEVCRNYVSKSYQNSYLICINSICF